MNGSFSEFLYFSLHFNLFLRRNSRGVLVHMTISRPSCPKTSASSAVCGEYVTAITTQSTSGPVANWFVSVPPTTRGSDNNPRLEAGRW